MIHIETVWDLRSPDLNNFYKKCAELGFKNNSSVEDLQINDKLDTKFWTVKKNSDVVSFSGCHYWLDENKEKTLMRCLIRSVTLPEYVKLVPGLSKTHMNSIPFSIILPYQIVEGLKNKVEHFYITTSNNGHDNSGKMLRTHKILQYLASKKIVHFVSNEIIYSTSQTKWEIDLENYHKALIGFHPTREALNLALTPEYYKIIHHGF